MTISEKLKAICIGMQRTAFMTARTPSNVGAMLAIAESIESDAAKLAILANSIPVNIDEASDKIDEMAERASRKDSIIEELMLDVEHRKEEGYNLTKRIDVLQDSAAKNLEQIESLQKMLVEVSNRNGQLKAENDRLGRVLEGAEATRDDGT